jgi:hypothetical protein
MKVVQSVLALEMRRKCPALARKLGEVLKELGEAVEATWEQWNREGWQKAGMAGKFGDEGGTKKRRTDQHLRRWGANHAHEKREVGSVAEASRAAGGGRVREWIDEELAGMRAEGRLLGATRSTLSIVWDGIRAGNPGKAQCRIMEASVSSNSSFPAPRFVP